IGLDVDLGHFEENRSALVKRGAFRQNKPELHEYNQLVSGRDRLEHLLDGKKLDVVIDDGLHSTESIITTWHSAAPFLAPCFVYFIEAYEDLPKVCGSTFSSHDCRTVGFLSLVSRGLAVK